MKHQSLPAAAVLSTQVYATMNGSRDRASGLVLIREVLGKFDLEVIFRELGLLRACRSRGAFRIYPRHEEEDYDAPHVDTEALKAGGPPKGSGAAHSSGELNTQEEGRRSMHK